MSASEPPLPLLEDETSAFWTGGKDGVLLIQRCADCGHWQHPPLPLCTTCHSSEVAPQPVGGTGTVKSYTENVQKWSAGMDVPFVFAAVELDEQEQLYVFTRITAPASAVACGARVSVHFERHEDVWLPLFRPIEGVGA